MPNQKQSPAPLSVIAISDGRAGNRRQALALATRLASSPRELILSPHAPWRWLAPRQLPFASEKAFGPGFADLAARQVAGTSAPVVVGCGRQAALATRLLRARGARAVQILDPRLDPRHWDLVIAPEHDRLHGDNVIAVAGSLHPVDDAWLDAARARFPTLAELPSPRIAVLVGGDSVHARFDAATYARLAAELRTARDHGGSLMITTSRRTPAAACTALRRDFGASALVWTGEHDGPNPYPGLLGWADRILCTADSVNMVSEACATRVPVQVFERGRAGGRSRAFLDALLASGRIGDAGDSPSAHPVVPLRETARVAALVRQRLRLPG